MLETIIVVLHKPQKLVNIASAVRAMKNMGLQRLRLVQPAEYDPAEIDWVAHRSGDIVEQIEVFADLDAALADTIYVAGTTARPRGAFPRVSTPREHAPMLLARAAQGPVALLFGPEDNGLTNTELDRCHAILSIPTDPAYSSLNLAQAVLLLAYELRMAEPPPVPPRTGIPPASAAQLEKLYEALEESLWAIEFFKTEHAESMMRTLRSLVHRAGPDTREAALLMAICRETIHFLKRQHS